MQTVIIMLPWVSPSRGAQSGITAHTEGMGLEIKAIDSGGSTESAQSTNHALCPSHVLIHANVVKSYVFE